MDTIRLADLHEHGRIWEFIDGVGRPIAATTDSDHVIWLTLARGTRSLSFETVAWMLGSMGYRRARNVSTGVVYTVADFG